MKLTVQPWQLGREDIARKYETLLIHFPHLEIVETDRGVARLAAQLRIKYNLCPPDALQAAACLAHPGKPGEQTIEG
jgi:predicted nucleic acid-binding protein